MGKTFRINQKHIQEHQPSEAELEKKDWKHQKPSKTKKLGIASNKVKHGHFTQQHIWPICNENKKGPKI